MAHKDKYAATKREYHAQAVQLLAEEMQTELNKWDRFLVEEKANKLQSDFEKFEAKGLAIMCDPESDKDAKEKCASEGKAIGKLYFSLLAALRKRSAALTSQSDLTSELNANASINQTENERTQAAQAKQKMHTVHAEPKVHRFTGSLNDWLTFKKAVQEKVINDENLTDELRMIELIQCCPQELLNEFKTDGFHATWQKLLDKYDGTYRLANFYTQKMLSLPKIGQPSSSSIAEMLNRMNEIKAAFETLGEFNAEHVMMFVLATKLDDETKRAWQRHRSILAESWAATSGKNKREHLPSLEALTKFLDDEKDVYDEQAIDNEAHLFGDAIETKSEALTNVSSHFACNYGATTSSQAKARSTPSPKEEEESTKAKVVSNAADERSKQTPGWVECIMCPPKTWHQLFKCTKYLALPIIERTKLVSRFNLCIKCLLPDHPGRCKDSRSNNPCERCKPSMVWHNSTLCENNQYAATRPIQKPTVVKDDDDWSS